MVKPRKGVTALSWLFSKRCRTAISQQRIVVRLPVRVRVRIWELLERHSESWWETTDGFSYQVTTLETIPKLLRAELGIEDLLSFPEDGGKTPEPGTLRDYVLRGVTPSHVFDILEVVRLCLSEDHVSSFDKGLNAILEEEGCPWRMANGKIFPVDSAYVEEELLRRATELAERSGFEGAQTEFEAARTALANNDYPSAIRNCTLALESAMKEILGVQHAKPGVLFHGIAACGIVPEYHEGFLAAFEEHLLRCSVVVRNQEPGVGHGKGAARSVVPRSLAEYCVNMTAVQMRFLIERWIEAKSGGDA